MILKVIYLCIFITIQTILSNSKLIFSTLESNRHKLQNLNLRSGIIVNQDLNDSDTYNIAMAASFNGLAIGKIKGQRSIEIEKITHREGDNCVNAQFIENGNEQYIIVANSSKGVCLYDLQGELIQCTEMGFQVLFAQKIQDNYLFITGLNKVAIVEMNGSNLIKNKEWENIGGQGIQFMQDPTGQFVLLADGPVGVSIFETQKLINAENNALLIQRVVWEWAEQLQMIKKLNTLNVYIVDKYYGLIRVDMSYLYQNNDLTNIVKEDLPQYDITRILVSQVQSLFKSNDDLLLFLGIRSIGIEIYDVSEPENPIKTQIIPTNQNIVSLIYNEENSIYVFNDLNIQIFSVIDTQYQQLIPNTFQSYKSTNQIITFTNDQNEVIQEYIPWRIKVEPEYIVTAAGRGGMIQYTKDVNNYDSQINPTFRFVVNVNSLDSPIDGLFVFEGHVFIGESNTGVSVYNLQTQQRVGQVYQYNGDADSIQVFEKEGQNYIVIGIGYQGIIIQKLTDQYLIEDDSSIQQYEFDVLGSVENVLVSKDSNFIYVSAREYGLLIFDFTNKNIVQKINKYRTSDIVMTILSFDEKTAYLSCGNQGILFINVEDKLNLKLINTIKLDGYAQKMKIYNYGQTEEKPEYYLFVSLNDVNILSVVNVTDSYNPVHLQKVAIQNEQSFDLELSENKQFLYLVTTNGLRTIPMYSNVQIYSQIFLRDDSDPTNIQYNIIKDGVAKVGQNIQLIITPYQTDSNQIIIDKIYYYKNYELQELPSFMVFNKVDVLVDIKVDKQMLIKQNSNDEDVNKSEIQLVVNVKNPLNENMFESLIGVTNQESQEIYDILNTNQYVQNNLLTTKLPEINQIYGLEGLSYLDDVKIKKIQASLLDHFHLIPIQFTVESSLKNNLIQTEDSSNNNDQNKEEKTIVDTLSQNLEVTITLNNPLGGQQFFPQIFEDVNIFYSQNYDQITLSGPASSVNSYLNQISVETYGMPKQNIDMTINIQDDVNNAIVKKTTMENISFLKQNQPVSINPEVPTLQQQFNSFYENGEIKIGEVFTFTWLQDSFIDENEITYKLYAILDTDTSTSTYGDEIEKQKNYEFYYLNFYASENKIEGFVEESMYRKIIILTVEATDGLTVTRQTIEVKIYSLPLSTILTWVISVVSVLASLLGLVKFRGIIYNLICQKKYQYGIYNVEKWKDFHLQMPMTRNSMDKAQKIFNAMIKNLKKKPEGVQILKIVIENIDLEEEKKPDDNIPLPSKRHQKEAKDLEIQKEDSNEKKLQKTLERLQTIKQKDIKDLTYIDLLFEVQLEEIKKKQKDGTTLKEQSKIFEDEDIDYDTFLYQQLKYLAYLYMLESNEFPENLLTLAVIQKLKEYSPKFCDDRREMDWYRHYVDIQYQATIQLESSFPILIFKWENIFEIIYVIFQNYKCGENKKKQLTLLPYNKEDNQRPEAKIFDGNFLREFTKKNNDEQFEEIEDYLKKIKIDKIDLVLLLNCISAEVWGIYLKESFLYQSRGESLTCKNHEINAVRALRRNPSALDIIFTKLNMHYKTIALCQNNPLPGCLSYQIKQNILEIKGIAGRNQFEKEYKIQITGINGQIFKEFIINQLNPGVDEEDEDQDIQDNDQDIQVNINSQKQIDDQEQQPLNKPIIKKKTDALPNQIYNDEDELVSNHYNQTQGSDQDAQSIKNKKVVIGSTQWLHNKKFQSKKSGNLVFKHTVNENSDGSSQSNSMGNSFLKNRTNIPKVKDSKGNLVKKKKQDNNMDMFILGLQKEKSMKIQQNKYYENKNKKFIQGQKSQSAIGSNNNKHVRYLENNPIEEESQQHRESIVNQDIHINQTQQQPTSFINQFKKNDEIQKNQNNPNKLYELQQQKSEMNDNQIQYNTWDQQQKDDNQNI